ncbi:hypothetical protein BK816_07570 [Boudabousia tangfeifanii]|uniref:Uncharacterized protein n=1 Tax=Boudabousia tangfeifanii TaxID=1912795 RepID=A0A1D9MLV6_9ACTO|nr:DUF1295 domain-containing protein [Boudabousia tangfeifanii]AOZ73169.1 hypothetical protein BK816_07570 [Boudabousia tangfeifanii]
MTSLSSAVIATIVIQLIGWAISAAKKTEKIFDLTGSATFAAVTIALLIGVGSYGEHAWARTLIGLMVIVWALRLGTFLTRRALKRGDQRFDEIKVNPIRFLIVWLIQALWISGTAAAAWSAITSTQTTVRLPLVFIGALVWLFGISLEALADRQKRAFQANPANRGKFIDTGLWSRSQHPNYFGEITLWVGVAIASASLLHGWYWLSLLSPVLVFVLLTKVSGIPTLDRSAKKKWGDDPAYQAYRRRTPVLVPKLR